MTKNSKAASKSAKKASSTNGTLRPVYSYKTPPNGGATRLPNEMNASAMPSAFDRSPSSVNRSAIMARPLVSANALPTPCKLRAMKSTEYELPTENVNVDTNITDRPFIRASYLRFSIQYSFLKDLRIEY